VYLPNEALKCYSNSVPLATNYHDLLVSVRRLPIQDFPHTISIRYFDEDERQPRPDPGPGDNRRVPTTHPVEIGLLPAARMSDLISLDSNPKNGSGTEVDDVFVALNILFSYRPRQLCVRSPSMEPTIAAVGAFRFYGLAESNDLAVDLEARRGILKNSRLTQDGVLLNVGSTTSALYQAGCLRLLFDEWEKAHENEFDYHNALEAFIKGVRVKTNYLIDHGRKEGGSLITEERVYTITGLSRTDKDPTPRNVSFELGDREPEPEAAKNKSAKARHVNASKGKNRELAASTANNKASKTVWQPYTEIKPEWSARIHSTDPSSQNTPILLQTNLITFLNLAMDLSTSHQSSW
jgi:hypothetical protein